ncbi:unnamed protein product [Adineta ricciae]|uniref:Uncharacterized protein n=1 Tax=Adineta ricciae TaxID=249248 RepID=A0A814TVH5_ADIRI|nr:unnamed protein product [Adineta ricciae]CAF1520130.1 unnamed protein product [Adineta ricciae]
MTEKILRFITQFAEIYAVYIFNPSILNVENHPKLRGVYQNDDELLNRLITDIQSYVRLSDSNPFSFEEKFYTTDFTVIQPIMSASWFFMAINLLLKLPVNSKCKQILVEHYRKETISDNDARFLEEFNKSYRNDDAVRWYTRTGFLFRTLNHLFRGRRVDKLAFFRFFIRDLYEQLRIFQQNQPWLSPPFYRGQLMSLDELCHISHMSILNSKFSSFRQAHLCASSFFSMTTGVSVALFFAGIGNYQLDNPVQSVLFVVKAPNSGRIPCTKPFASINHVSYFETENEILFSTGTLFDIQSIRYHSMEYFWTIELLLVDENLANEIREVSNMFSNVYIQYFIVSIYFTPKKSRGGRRHSNTPKVTLE